MQLARPYADWTPLPQLKVAVRASSAVEPAAPAVDEPVAIPALTLANGLGGFADNGRTYVVVLEGANK